MADDGKDGLAGSEQRPGVRSLVPRVGISRVLSSLLAKAPGCMPPGLFVVMNPWAHGRAAGQKMGGAHLTFGCLNKLPVLPPSAYSQPAPWSPGETVAEWMLRRVLELVYTSWEMKPFARDCGYEGPPFTWDEVRRFQLRCELDAAFFYLYGIGRDDVESIMVTFPIVKRKDEARWGEYRTRRMILTAHNRLSGQVSKR